MTKEGFRALQRQVQELQEELHRGDDIREGDESEDEFEEEEEQFEGEQEVRNHDEDRFFKVFSKIRKRTRN